MTLKHQTEVEARYIDLDGPDGNAFVLLGFAASWARQLDLDEKMVTDWMKSGDYVTLLAVFERFFGSICELRSSNAVLLAEVAERAADLSEG
jgi:hypothetical protein